MCGALAEAVASVSAAAPAVNEQQLLVSAMYADRYVCHDDRSVYVYNIVCNATPEQLHLDMQDAVQGVTQAAASAGTSGHGKLDRSLKKLLLSIDAASSSDRLAFPVWVWSVANMLDCAHVGAMALDFHTFTHFRIQQLPKMRTSQHVLAQGHV